MTISKRIDEWLEDAQNDLIANYNRIGLRASGRFEKEVEGIQTETKDGYNVKVLGASYTYQLENGRLPNKNQSKLKGFAWYASKPTGFIYEWCQDKGIDTKFAFPIAYNIGMFGIKVPNPFNSGGLVSSIFTQKRIDELIESVGIGYLESASSDIIKEFK